MIRRSIRHDSIRYILGATGEGRRHLRNFPNVPLSWINYVFIDNDEAVRAWLMSNPVLDDPLDLMIYCHRVQRESREPTPALRGHNYLVAGPAAKWEAIARAQLRRGSQQPEAKHPEARADPGPANEAGEPQEGDDSDALLAALSGVPSDVSGARDGREGSVGMLSSSGGERRESPAKRIPLALKSSSQLNIQQSTELGRCPAHGDMRQKRRGLFDDENCDERKSKRFRLVSMAREFLDREEARKRSASFDDKESHECQTKRFRSSLVSESLMDLTARLSFAEST